jgi:FKBP-type peptidyl-prolyl cis-trans isomerase FkpA
MMNQFLMIAIMALFGGWVTTQMGWGQEGSAGSNQDKQENAAVVVPLTTGPEDAQEKVAPGKIDDDASPDYVTTDSGLKYRILRASKMPKPEAGDTITVHYKGWLSSNKTIFDSSYRRGKTISFPLSGVIAGWTEGMQLVGVGGMIELVIPAKLAYGAQGVPAAKIPPNAELTFLVELVEIK